MEHQRTIYGTSTCASCAMAKDYLKSKNSEYEFKNVGEGANAREEMIGKNGGMLTTPTIEIDDKIIVGFDKEKIDVLLGITG